jgi:hypothetical protein
MRRCETWGPGFTTGPVSLRVFAFDFSNAGSLLAAPDDPRKVSLPFPGVYQKDLGTSEGRLSKRRAYIAQLVYAAR